jgi:hypothetical protein
MGDCTYDRLSARVAMDMLNDNTLLSTTTKFSQRVHLRGKGFCQAGGRKRI